MIILVNGTLDLSNGLEFVIFFPAHRLLLLKVVRPGALQQPCALFGATATALRRVGRNPRGRWSRTWLLSITVGGNVF